MSSSSNRVYETIRNAILSGEYRAGTHLKEVELARRLEVSRTPVREALRQLGAEGLVRLRSNQGVIVSGWSRKDIEEIFCLRALLEGHAAGLAARRATAADIAELEDLCARGENAAARDLSLLAEINAHFHDRIVVLSGNNRLAGTAARTFDLGLALGTFARYSASALERSLRQHREIVDALRQGDAIWAEAIMRAHILSAQPTILAGLDPHLREDHERGGAV